MKEVTTVRFRGPLFIIGFGRSGTKLLRDLLNQNPRIGIPVAETGFIPYMVNRFGDSPGFEANANKYRDFYDALTQTNFFWWMRQEGLELSWEEMQRLDVRTSWSCVLEFVYRFYAPAGRSDGFMWGDKTPGPSHTTHMPLLKSLFPDARFLHVIRDPRDVCLSMQKTFGKSLYRSAEMWRQIVTAARSYGHRLGRDYREVFYELLLQDPAAVMQEICEFIECEYIPAMIELARPAEQYGAARGQTQIVPGNFGKYRVHLSKSQIKRIEQIVLPELRSTPYQPENRVRFRPLPPPVLAMLTLYDTWTTLRFDIKEKGLGEAPGYFYNALKSYLAVLSNSERPSA